MEVAAEGVGVLGAEVGLNAAQGEVHAGEASRGGVALLAVDADVAELAAVGFDEFFRLHEHAFEAGVVALDGDHGVVHDFADGRLFGAGLKVGPATLLGHPEDVFGFVFVGVFGIRPGVVALAGDELGVVLLEGVGDIFEEDVAENDVLILRRIHVVPQLISREPELRLEAEVGGGVFGAVFWGAGEHD